MGYILPYIPIQRMQYAIRMEKPEQGLPVVPVVPSIKNDTFHTPDDQKKRNSIEGKKRFQQVLNEIEGKGLIINETI